MFYEEKPESSYRKSPLAFNKLGEAGIGLRLEGTIAVVTGASRGIGKGIALGLGEAGATVYVTGRSTKTNPGTLAGTIEETAEEVTRLGGRGIAVRCDHRVDRDVETLFDRVRRDENRVDLLVNNAFASPDQLLLWSGQRFWEIPIALWDDIIDVGLRSHFIASRFALPLMLERQSGLIVNVASHAAGSGKTLESRSILPYSVGKAGLHRMTADMAVELSPYRIAVLAVWPPGSRTEGVLARSQLFPSVAQWAEPAFTGRVLAALIGSGDLLGRSGQSLAIRELAAEFGLEASNPPA